MADPISQYSNIQPLVQLDIQNALKKYSDQNAHGVKKVPIHNHDGVNSPLISTAIQTVVGKMYLSATQTISNNSNTIITLNTSSIALGVTIDTANNKIIILTAGYYSISGQVGWTQSTDAKNYKSFIVVNSTEVVTGYAHASVTGSYYITSPLNTVVSLSVNDYIQLKCSQASGGTQTVGGGENYTYLAINKIN